VELIMRRVPALLVPACLALSAVALSAGGAAAANGEFGGGFIELLMTGSAGPTRFVPPAATPVPAAQTAALTTGEAEAAPAAEFRRQEVDYSGREAPGTIVIDTPQKFLFLVEPGGRAIRYGVGVGRPGFEWSGVKSITRKAEWPGWTPPPQMMLRRPDLPAHMDGGPANPLGARALYLGSSMYRIHGTNEPETIGRDVSSGCIRMMNEDVIDLYNRVRVGTKVIVI
jgi:lipoprotein-anchoring transpeptidase ErfK/SrfK